MPRLKVMHVQEIEVNVSNAEILKQAVALVAQSVGLGTHHFLSVDKQRICYDDPDHRHGSVRELTLRSASDADREAFAVMVYLTNRTLPAEAKRL